MARRSSQTAGLIKVRCPNPACKKILAVKSAMGGKKARCPLCGQTMAIPKVAAPAAKPAPKEKPGPSAPPAAPPEDKQKAEEKKAPPPPETTPPPEGPPPEKEEEKPEGPPPPEPTPPSEPAPPEAPPEEKKEAEGAAPPKDEVFFGGAAAPPEKEGAAKADEKAAAPPEPEPSPEGPGPALPPTRPGAESVMVGAPSPKGQPTPRTLERVAKEAAETGYELLGGQLRVVGAIGYDLNTGFRDKCDQLLASGEKDLLVDLSQVLYLSSSHIGVIARLATEAASQERTVKVRVTGKVARVLKFAGIDRLVELEDVDA
ncbi:MAG: STAS domain-containing protein [Planctomycetota bacterium]|jgi:anti-anti-sigma factor